METEVKDQFLSELVKDYIAKLPEKKKEKLWDEVLQKILVEELRFWKLDEVVTDEVKKHVVVYLQKPEVQEKLKMKAQEIADKLCDGTFAKVGRDIEKTLKSKYTSVFEED